MNCVTFSFDGFLERKKCVGWWSV